MVLAPFIEELAKVFPLFYRHGETQRSLVTLGLLDWVGVWDCRIRRIRRIRWCITRSQIARHNFSCFQRNHNRVWSCKKESVALLPNSGGIACCQQLFRDSRRHF